MNLLTFIHFNLFIIILTDVQMILSLVSGSMSWTFFFHMNLIMSKQEKTDADRVSSQWERSLGVLFEIALSLRANLGIMDVGDGEPSCSWVVHSPVHCGLRQCLSLTVREQPFTSFVRFIKIYCMFIASTNCILLKIHFLTEKMENGGT